MVRNSLHNCTLALVPESLWHFSFNSVLAFAEQPHVKFMLTRISNRVFDVNNVKECRIFGVFIPGQALYQSIKLATRGSLEKCVCKNPIHFQNFSFPLKWTLEVEKTSTKFIIFHTNEIMITGDDYQVIKAYFRAVSCTILCYEPKKLLS